MDIDLIHKVAEEHKINIDKVSKRKSEPENTKILKKILVEYTEKVLIENFNSITKRYCEIDKYFDPSLDSRIEDEKKDKIGYETLFNETRISLVKLLNQYRNKEQFTTSEYKKELEGILNNWMFWSGMDDYTLKNKLKDKYNTAIVQISVINTDGWKIIKEWYDFKKEYLLNRGKTF